MKKPAPKRNSARAVTDVDRQVGVNVRKLRTAQGMTLVELSEELGISHQQLQKYETGSNRLSAGILMAMSERLGVPVSELFDTGGTTKKSSESESDRLKIFCQRIIERTRSRKTLDIMARVLKAIDENGNL